MTEKNPIIGITREFDHVSMEWQIYKPRLEQYFEANDISDQKKKKAIFLTLLTEGTYKLLRDLCYPKTVDAACFMEVIKALHDHLQGATSVFVEREMFYEAQMEESETIQDWSRQVRRKAVNCNFGVVLETVMRDKFVLGLRKGTIRDKLFAYKDEELTFNKAVEAATEFEAAQKVKLHEAATAAVKQEPVYKLKAGSRQKSGNNNKLSENKNQVQSCTCCGFTNHSYKNCRYKGYNCRQCGKRGHLKKVCRSKQKNNKNEDIKILSTKAETADSSNRVTENMFNLQLVSNMPIKVNCLLNGKSMCGELDSGAAVSCISSQFYKTELRDVNLAEADLDLKTYTGENERPLGKCKINFTFENKIRVLDLYVIEGGSEPIFGRDFMRAFNIQFQVNSLQPDSNNTIGRFVSSFPTVFTEKLGQFKFNKAKLYLIDNAQPKYIQPRPLPFTLKSKVEAQLKILVEQGILIPTKFSNWGTPIVPVLKKDGTVRICGDYKVTLNSQLKNERHVVPRIEDIFEKLSGSTVFSKIDLSSAYQKIELEEDSQELTTKSTHLGLFKYTRCPYGIKTMPAIFQGTMERVLVDIPKTAVFFYDILVGGKDLKDHLHNLRLVALRLKEAGLTANESKCQFLQKSVTYLGFHISKEGLHPNYEKTSAIGEMAPPSNVRELQAFIGMTNYYRKFVPAFAQVLSPLYKLLQRDHPWDWNKECQIAFNKIKEFLVSSEVLVHFNPKIPLELTVDASNDGLGAILSHVFEDGFRKTIAYASRTLHDAEKKYSQIDKEALAIYFGIKHFHQYLYGLKFTLHTDCRPLLSIFGSKKGIPQMAGNRLQRYALFLSGYDFDITYIKSELNNADFLSRLPVSSAECMHYDDGFEDIHIKYITENKDIPLKASDIAAASEENKDLKALKFYIANGWPKSNVKKSLEGFSKIKDELTVEKGCVLWGYKVIIPHVCRPIVLKQLHESHLGISKTKALARSYVYWPKINNDIENLIKNCTLCNRNQPDPPKASISPWIWSENPWERIHLDFFSPIYGKSFLICIDSSTKWPEVYEMPSINERTTVEKLREIFARFGLPKIIMSDNGPSFTSEEFQTFCRNYGIEHRTCAPYHPQSKGQAENLVKSVKKSMRKLITESKNIPEVLSRLLFNYRITPHITTGMAPAKLMFGRNLRSKLDLLRPNQNQEKPCNPHEHRMSAKQTKQKMYFKGIESREFAINQKVWVRDFKGNKKFWLAGTVTGNIGKKNVFS